MPRTRPGDGGPGSALAQSWYRDQNPGLTSNLSSSVSFVTQ